MLEKNNPHRHFRMTEKDFEHIFSSGKKMAILIFVALVVCLCVVLLLISEKTNNNNESVVVADEKSFMENQDSINLKEKYQMEVRKIILKYLEQRKELKGNDLSNCQIIVKQTVEQIMQLVVPAEFKKFHLELVIAMDKENNDCLDKDSWESPEVKEFWDEFKQQNLWLDQ